MQKVTAEGPFTMPPIDHELWLLGQLDSGHDCSIMHSHMHTYTCVLDSGLKKKKKSGLLFSAAVRKKIKQEEALGGCEAGGPDQQNLKCRRFSDFSKVPRGSSARSVTEKKRADKQETLPY